MNWREREREERNRSITLKQKKASAYRTLEHPLCLHFMTCSSFSCTDFGHSGSLSDGGSPKVNTCGSQAGTRRVGHASEIRVEGWLDDSEEESEEEVMCKEDDEEAGSALR